MNISVPKNPFNAIGPKVTFVLGDNGSAHVSITLSIANVIRIQHDETYSGTLTRTVPINPGSYECTLVIAAFRTGALGPVYASSISINGQVAATANGSIQGGNDSDFAYERFTLVVS